jgi:hemerythrin
MILFEWSADYEIGIPEIDAQHRGLVNMLNDLHVAMKAGKGSEAVQKTVERLLSYTQQHFEAEEWAMKQAHYPEFAKHHKAHLALTTKVVEMLGAGGALPTFELLNFLNDWLKKHIGQTDREFGDFIRARRNATLSPPPL